MTTFADIVGVRVIDGRGEFVKSDDRGSDDSARHVVMRLDGICYAFVENPSDGYRSCLASIEIVDRDSLPAGSFVEFAPLTINVANLTTPMSQWADTRDDVIVGVDERTGLAIFEIGTCNLDDYYPSFVSTWTPDGAQSQYLTVGAA